MKREETNRETNCDRIVAVTSRFPPLSTKECTTRGIIGNTFYSNFRTADSVSAHCSLVFSPSSSFKEQSLTYTKHRLSSAGPIYQSVQLMTIRHRSLNHTPAPPTLQLSLNTPRCHIPPPPDLGRGNIRPNLLPLPP